MYPYGAISSEPSEAVLLVVLWHAGLEAEGLEWRRRPGSRTKRVS